MKPTRPWHFTPAGRVVRFLGSVQLAIPVLVVVAAALAWGTYLESTQSTKIARAAVYGAEWFLGLMVLVCVSLVFAVITRYPWKRKHIGFITVHTGLILLIIGGFWSMYGRVEGHLTLEEGMTGDSIELDEDTVDLIEMNAGAMKTVGSTTAPAGPARLNLNGISIEVLERWANAREEQYVANDGPVPYRAVEVALNPSATEGTWIGDEVQSGSPGVVEGLVIRVLPDGGTWEPPVAVAAEESGFAFVVGQSRYPVAAEGKEAFPGWTIESVRRFTHATVSAGTISESDEGGENPAMDVVVTDGKGTRERHTAFTKFPEMIMSRTLEGTAKSGARLLGGAPRAGAESIVFYGSIADPKVGYVSPEGKGELIAQTGTLPWTFQAGKRTIRILQQFANAQNASRFTKAPPGAEQRPALVIRPAGASETAVLAWKAFATIPSAGRNLVLRYGPRTAPLPFKVTLKDFRKQDYPGTDMAMAYESDVTIATSTGEELPYRIYMNNPYAKAPWKVYQSGFVGDKISVFSVMKDPGIPLTYVGSIVLCVGLILTFYSRSLSWGHPGIPIGLVKKETEHEEAAPVVDRTPGHGVTRPDLERAGVA